MYLSSVAAPLLKAADIRHQNPQKSNSSHLTVGRLYQRERSTLSVSEKAVRGESICELVG